MKKSINLGSHSAGTATLLYRSLTIPWGQMLVCFPSGLTRVELLRVRRDLYPFLFQSRSYASCHRNCSLCIAVDANGVYLDRNAFAGLCNDCVLTNHLRYPVRSYVDIVNDSAGDAPGH